MRSNEIVSASGLHSEVSEPFRRLGLDDVPVGLRRNLARLPMRLFAPKSRPWLRESLSLHSSELSTVVASVIDGELALTRRPADLMPGDK